MKRVAVVTGAGGGIGRATSLALARRGYALAICDIDEVALARTASELGPSLRLAERVDVADADAVAAFAGRIEAPHALVNNAGVGVAGQFTRTTADDWRFIVGVNLLGPVNALHAFLPGMLERGDGHVINVVSALGYFAAPGVSPYVATKFGLLGLTLSLRTELAQRGIRVSAVCPGLVNTQIASNARVRTASQGSDDKVRELFRRGRPPEGVADAIVGLLARDRAVLPVFPEAWALWYASRLAPGLGQRLGRLMLRNVVGRDNVRAERDATASSRSTR